MSTGYGEEKSSIGQRLREERARLSLSQADLGGIFDVDRKVVRNYEENKTSPRADQLEAFRVQGADVIYILTGQRLALAVQEDRAAYTPAQHLAYRVAGMNLDDETVKMLQVIIDQFVALDAPQQSRVQGYLDGLSDQSAVIENSGEMISCYDFSPESDQNLNQKQG